MGLGNFYPGRWSVRVLTWVVGGGTATAGAAAASMLVFRCLFSGKDVVDELRAILLVEIADQHVESGRDTARGHGRE